MTRTNPIFIKFFICILFSTPILKAQDANIPNLSPMEPEAFEVMRQFYDYDKVIPLDLKIVDRVDKKDYVREKIMFRGHRSQVSGYVAIPKSGREPYPVVLLVHGVTSSKESWWEEHTTMGRLTSQLLTSGYVVMTLDAEYHGERAVNSAFKSPLDIINNEWFTRYRDMIIESVIDYRRGIDYLTTRTDIDTSKIGMIGYSMGGMMTFFMSAIDERIDVSVSCVSPIITVPYLPTAIQNYAPYIKETPFLMLMAKNDERNYTEASAKQLYNLINSPTKNLIFFDSGHMLPEAWTTDATKWIGKYLK